MLWEVGQHHQLLTADEWGVALKAACPLDDHFRVTQTPSFQGYSVQHFRDLVTAIIRRPPPLTSAACQAIAEAVAASHRRHR